MTFAPTTRQKSPLRNIFDHDFLMMHELQKMITAALGEVHGIVLDVGCGHQPYRRWIKSDVTYVGIDIDSTDSTPTIVSNSMRLPFQANTFDSAICFEVLEHVSNPFVVVNEIARVLQPGGILLLSTPQSWRLHEAPYDYFRYTRFGLQHIVQESGLNVEHIIPIGGVWSHVAQTSLNAWPHHQLGRFLNPAIALTNVVFYSLNKLWHDTRDPLGHLLIAHKATEQQLLHNVHYNI